MTTPAIIAISVGSALIAVVLFVLIARFIASHRKSLGDGLKKKVEKIQKEQSKSKAKDAVKTAVAEPAAPAAPDAPAKDAEKQDKPKISFSEKSKEKDNKKHATPIFSDYVPEEEKKNDDAGQQPSRLEEMTQRRSLDELLRTHNKNISDGIQQKYNDFLNDSDEDFEKFRQIHSSYPRYQKDNAIVRRIQALPPEQRAIVLENIFSKFDN